MMNRTAGRMLLSAVALCGLTSCWELKESQNEPGVAYKVNRLTGQVERIDGYSAIAVKTVASTSPEERSLFNT